MAQHRKVLLVAPRFYGQSFWNFTAACELYGARFPSAPLGLITVAALLPNSWECRLVNRNTEELTDAHLDWADLVMTGGMLPQRPDTLHVIALAKQRGKPVIVGGPDVTSSPDEYASADCRVLGEAEGIIASFISAWESRNQAGRIRSAKIQDRCHQNTRSAVRSVETKSISLFRGTVFSRLSVHLRVLRHH